MAERYGADTAVRDWHKRTTTMTLARLALGAAMILVCLHSATAQGIDPKRQRAAYCLGFVISAKAQFSTADAAVLQALNNLQHRAAIYLSLTGGFNNNTTHGLVLGKVTTDRCFAAELQCGQACKSAADIMRCMDECDDPCQKM
jgi:hypothetical protein